MARFIAEGFVSSQGDKGPFSASGGAAADVGEGCGARTCGKDEFLKPGQIGVDAFKGVIDIGQGLLGENVVAGHGELAAQVEELVLDGGEECALFGGHGFAKEHSNVGVEFVNISQGDDAWVVLGKPRVVGQSRGAIIAGAGCDLSESVAHEISLEVLGKDKGK